MLNTLEYKIKALNTKQISLTSQTLYIYIESSFQSRQEINKYISIYFIDI